MNYFELFDLAIAPTVDKANLSKKYFELQKASHPDFFTQSNETEKEYVLERSASINKAFNIFQNDEKTIEYFLQIKNFIEPDEKFNLPPDFLMDMMEINEALTENDEEDVIQRVSNYEDNLWKGIKNIIENYSENITEKDQFLKLKEYYYKKKYLKRILDRLSD